MNDTHIYEPIRLEAIAFIKLVRSFHNKINASHSSIDLDLDSTQKARDEISQYEFYRWVSKQRKFQKSVDYLRNKGLDISTPLGIEIEIINFFAWVYLTYHRNLDNPLKVTNKSTSDKAIISINQLLKLFDEGLQFEELPDELHLTELLHKLNLELTSSTTTYPTSRRGDILVAHSVRQIQRLLRGVIGQAPTFVIANLMSIIEEVSEQNVRRYIKKAIS